MRSDLKILKNICTYCLLQILVTVTMAQATQDSVVVPASTNYSNASFLRMDNLNIGYDFGRVVYHKKAGLRLNASVQNVFVITKYKGFDPEVNTDAGFGGIPSLGVEYIPYPSARTVQLGINFSL